MSDMICPDCHTYDIQRLNEFDQCDFCGWKGLHLPFEELTEESYEMIEREIIENKKLRKNGELYFIRIYTNSSDNSKNVIDKMTELNLIFFETKYEITFSLRHYIILYWNNKPTENFIKKIKSLEDVVDAIVY